MSGFTERTSGDVKIKHHSTASMIEIIVNSTDPLGKPDINNLYVDYKEFQDLYNALQTFVNEDGTKDFPLT